MTDSVIDASALIFALTTRSSAAADFARRLADMHCQAPHLIDAECGSSLRKLARLGELTTGQAFSALVSARSMIDIRHPHHDLSDMAWSLRDQLTFYDALYVALAAQLDVSLVTCDRRLANAHSLPCRVELVG